MKKILFLYLMFLSFSANVFAQKKETTQSKTKTVSTIQPKKELKAKATLQPKEKKPIQKKPEVKKKVQTPALKNPKPKLDSIGQKKTMTKSEDTIRNNKSGSEQGLDTHKVTKTAIPINAESANGKNDINTNQTNSSSFNFLSILPYGIIAALLGLLILLFARSNKKIETLESELKQNKDTGSYQVTNLNEQIKKLESEKKNLIEQEEAIREELRVERKKNQVQFQSQQINEPAKQQEIVQPAKQESPIKYARYADQGDGFTASDLLSEEDNDTIFEITITSPNTATFKVANNLNAQKYALSNAAYFLGKTCKYDSTPSQNSIIRTDNEGELKLQGSKWLILNPVKISFT